MELLIKILITPIVGYLFFRPFFQQEQNGIINQINAYGLVTFILIAISFLLLVFGYCYTLFKTLKLTNSINNKVDPKSAWLMFIIPLNFIEDFFIIRNVSQSIKQEKITNSKLDEIKSFGLKTGTAWCLLQIISLFPNRIGEISGLLAIPFWIYHWYFCWSINQKLTK